MTLLKNQSLNEGGEKSATMNYLVVAYNINNIYLPKDGKSKTERLLRHWITKSAILMQNALCVLRLLNSGLIALVVFKTAPSLNVKSKMKNIGYILEKIPINPYAAMGGKVDGR